MFVLKLRHISEKLCAKIKQEKFSDTIFHIPVINIQCDTLCQMKSGYILSWQTVACTLSAGFKINYILKLQKVTNSSLIVCMCGYTYNEMRDT